MDFDDMPKVLYDVVNCSESCIYLRLKNLGLIIDYTLSWKSQFNYFFMHFQSFSRATSIFLTVQYQNYARLDSTINTSPLCGCLLFGCYWRAAKKSANLFYTGSWSMLKWYPIRLRKNMHTLPSFTISYNTLSFLIICVPVSLSFPPLPAQNMSVT